jgi:hypothetical protein
MKKMKKILSSALLFSLNFAAFSQFNPATNSIEKMENIVVTSDQTGNDAYMTNLTGVPCSQNTFFAVGGGQIISFTLNGNIITNNGSVATAGGGGLAYCNNLDGGSFSPTFYTNSTFTKAAYYTGTGWTTCSAPPVSWVINAGGNGNFLYFTSNDSVTYDQVGIVRYNGSSYSTIYTLSDTSRALTVADVAVDDAGNVWFFTGKYYNLVSDTLNVVSPAGQLLKQFPFSYNTYNAYGCFMLNGILYIGLGGSNPDHPNTLIPVTITNNEAVAGDPIEMPVASYSDLASCNAGSPLAIIDENHAGYSVNIFPSPTHDLLYIDVINPSGSSSTLRIYNNLGAIVFQSSFMEEHKVKLDCSSFANGIYLAEIISGESKVTQKFIVQH